MILIPPASADPYVDFADRYDLFFGGFDEHDEARAAFLKALLEEIGARRVLDCACGTGKDLYLLRAAGYHVIGADRSSAMLRRGHRNLVDRGATVPLSQADFRRLPFAGNAFDAVICLTTSLPHLLDETEVVEALRSMHAVVRADGLLLLSQGITDKLLSRRPRFIPEIQTRDFTRLFVMDYFDTTVHIHVLDFIHGDGEREFKTASFEYAILLPSDYQRLLSAAGFDRIEFHDGYTRDPYRPEESDQLVVIARKL